MANKVKYNLGCNSPFLYHFSFLGCNSSLKDENYYKVFTIQELQKNDKISLYFLF